MLQTGAKVVDGLGSFRIRDKGLGWKDQLGLVGDRRQLVPRGGVSTLDQREAFGGCRVGNVIGSVSSSEAHCTIDTSMLKKSWWDTGVVHCSLSG